jgi:hypothetical protein
MAKSRPVDVATGGFIAGTWSLESAPLGLPFTY